jgi:hypothetical protein
MPGVAFPPGGSVGRGAPPAPGRCSAKTATRPLSGGGARRSRPDTLPASVRPWGPRRARDRVEAPKPRQGLCSPGPPIREGDKETGGSPTFPRGVLDPCPRASRTAAFRPLEPVGFPLRTALRDILVSPRRYALRGAITRPVSSFHPAPYAHCWVGTWMSLLTCWRGFGPVGLVPTVRTHGVTSTNFLR